MPEKDPSLWWALVEVLSELSPAVKGMLMAIVVAFLRLAYDEQETRWWRKLLEVSLCGALTLSASSVIRWLGLPEDLAIFVGGCIGGLGSQKIRDVALGALRAKADKL